LGVTGTNVVASSDPLIVQRLGELGRTGSLNPWIERVYPLDRVTEGFGHIASAKARGKLGVSLDPTVAVPSSFDTAKNAHGS
jgi:hypothetical protein